MLRKLVFGAALTFVLSGCVTSGSSGPPGSDLSPKGSHLDVYLEQAPGGTIEVTMASSWGKAGEILREPNANMRHQLAATDFPPLGPSAQEMKTILSGKTLLIVPIGAPKRRGTLPISFLSFYLHPDGRVIARNNQRGAVANVPMTSWRLTEHAGNSYLFFLNPRGDDLNLFRLTWDAEKKTILFDLMETQAANRKTALLRRSDSLGRVIDCWPGWVRLSPDIPIRTCRRDELDTHVRFLWNEMLPIHAGL